MLRAILAILLALVSASTSLAYTKQYGELGPGDSFDRVRSGCYADVSYVSMMGGQTYTIILESMHFDPFLRVESPEGVALASNDDGAGALHSLVVFRAPRTGNYRIISTSFAQRATGRYVMQVLDGEWVVQNVFRGSLQRSDPIYRVPAGQTPAYLRIPSNSHFDAYNVMMPGVPRPNHYLVQMISKDFDAFLVVERNLGWTTWRWGTGGSGFRSVSLDTNSFGPLSRDEGVPGSYRIVALAGSGQTGDYVVRVLRQVRPVYY